MSASFRTDSLEPYLLAAGWQRLAQSMPFVGRTAETGQQGQSVLLSCQLTRDLNRYASRWTGDWSTGLPLVGAIEQWVDNTEILTRPHNRPAVIAAYRAWLSNSGR